MGREQIALAMDNLDTVLMDWTPQSGQQAVLMGKVEDALDALRESLGLKIDERVR